ncbi:MAG: molecular chaperone TorD family protein [bacterium]
MEGLIPQEKDRGDKAEEAERISAVYKLLSRIFIGEVDAPFLRQVRTEGFCESLKSAGIDFGDEFLSRNEEELLEDLAVEYARLFIVPGISLPPYESVYAEGMLSGESAQQVGNFYRKCGMEVVEASFLPDHVGLELELMSYLKQKEADALKNGNQDTSRWMELQKEFMADHLGKWVPQFFTMVEKGTESPFYKEMAKLGRELLVGCNGYVFAP